MGPTLQAALQGLEGAGLEGGGVVLDVGVGAGWSSLFLAPPATRLIGVDSDPAMLAAFADNCRERGVDYTVVEGAWPEPAGRLEVADVVVSAHVVYNVAAILPFVRALSSHARRRVVIECTAHHPTAWMAPLWEHFHDLRRPERPTGEDLLQLLRECGLAVHVVWWDSLASPAETDPAELADFVTRRLCLPSARRAEVAEALRTIIRERQNLTVWWEPG